MRRNVRGFLNGLVSFALMASAAEASFARRKPITIDPLQVTGPSDLASFPVLVSLADTDLRLTPLGDVTSGLGHDIVFRAEDAATCGGPATCLLAHEIETYDPATGTLVAFVRVPVLSTTNPTVLYMYYGDASVTCAQENPTGVWDSSFREVFHLDETGDSTDSTLNGYGAVTKGTVNQGVSGKIGRAADFNGPTHSRLIASDGAMAASASFTFEAWIYLDTLQSGQFTGLVTKGRESGTHWAGLFKTGTNRIALGWQCCNPPTQPGNLNGPVLVAGQWYYAAATFDGVGKVRTLYVDGLPVATDNNADHAGFVQYLRMGDDSNGQYHDGKIDEVRVSDVVRSADWIQTTYNNQNAPGTFYAVGAEDPSPPAVNGNCATEAPCQGIGSGTCHYRSIGTRPDYGTAGPEGSGTTVSVNTASTVVTGSGTAWITANRGRGDRITIEGVDYTVLSVDTETRLRLSSPFTGASGGGKTYNITRKFGTLASWESCLDGPVSAACEGAFTADLVADNRGEVGIVYNDGAPYTYSAVGTPVLNINGQTTDRTHTITLTVDPRNRHTGVAGTGVFVDNDANTTWAIAVQDEFVTVEWLRVSRGGAAGAHAFNVVAGALQNSIVLRNHLIHGVSGSGLRVNSTDARVDFYNNIVYATGNRIVDINQTLAPGSLVRLLNNTFFNPGAQGIRSAAAENPLLLLRNNMIFDGSPGFNVNWIHVGSSHNLSDDTAPATLPPTFFISDAGHSPRGGGVYGASIASVNFVDIGLGSENLHIQDGSSAEDQAANLSFLFSIDIDGVARDAPWDIGADEFASVSHFRSIGTRVNYGTAAPEGAGTTITATSGTAIVSGSGTTWQTANRGRGDRITIDGVDYTILSVDSETQITLTSSFIGVSGSGKAYTIARKFATLAAWEDCIDGPGGAGCEGVATSSLVADNRSEVGIAYKDSVFAGGLVIDGSVTDLTHTITLTADPGNRHLGIAGTGVVVNNGVSASDAIWVDDDHVTLEWLEVKNGGGGADGIDVRGTLNASNRIVLRNLLVHDTPGSGIQSQEPDLVASIYNNIVYRSGTRGIVSSVSLSANANVEIFNNTSFANGNFGFDALGSGQARILLRNNLAHSNAPSDYNMPLLVATSSHNLAGDATGTTHSPGGGGVNGVLLANLRFVSTTPGLENLHIQNGSAAQGAGTNLASYFTNDVDDETRDFIWEVGADDITTVVHYRSIGTRVNYGTAAPEGGGTTVTATNGSALVTGAGTTWATSNRGRGDRITIDGVDYTILAVDSNTQLRLAGSFVGATGSGKSYTIARKFGTLAAWEDCIDGPGGAGCEGVSSSSLVLDNRREVGIAYKDSIFTAGVDIDGSTTDALRYITLTADGTNRHYGLEAAGVDIDGGSSTAGEVLVQDDYTVVEWLEVSETVGGANTAGFRVNNATNVLLQYLISQDNWNGIRVTGAGASSVTIRNSIIYNNQNDGISGNTAVGGDTIVIENSTVFGHTQYGIDDKLSTLVIRNTISMNNLISDFSVGAITASNNISRDGTAPGTASLPNRNHTSNPTPPAGNWVIFVSTSTGTENFHLVNNPAENDAMNNGVNLSGSFTGDIDGGLRTVPWDIGADDVLATTAVEIVRLEARGLDGAVELVWETASELDNLGFHVLRASVPTGPYERITSRIIPGLGSSPQGALYRYRDANVANGTTYFYQLVDIETSGQETLHGPVSATPDAGMDDGDEAETRIRYGNPEASVFTIAESDSFGVTIELRTEGFYATPQDDGTVRIEVPGFEEGATRLPLERVWVAALAGRHVDVRRIEGFDVETFSSLVPVGESLVPEARRSGTVRLRRARSSPAQQDAELARLASVAFQGETKKALVEFLPFSWDGARLVLVRHIRVKLSFARRDPQESATGRRARIPVESRELLARLSTSSAGLHAVAFENVIRRAPVPAADLRLSRQGASVPFHVEPRPDRFGPGSTLYFVSAGPDANPYGSEVVYTLERASGETMPLEAARGGSASLTTYWHDELREENRLYQAGLVSAPELWFWDLVMSGATKTFGFEVEALASAATPARLRVALQGTSDSSAYPDHHVRLQVNGAFAGETWFDGKTSHEVELEIPAGVLVEGANELAVENTGDADAPYSMILLDRFAVSYPRELSSAPRAFVARFETSGTATVSLPGARVVDLTEGARWVAGVEPVAGGARFSVQAGRRYAITAPDDAARPRVSFPRLPSIGHHRADLVVIGPRALVDAAAPLLRHRRLQGLAVREVTTEEIYATFGFGEPSPLAVRSFIAHAYHEWARPRLRYVLLVGDGSYDFKDYLGTGAANDVPPLMVKTDYLWTASDPAYAAVHGDDDLPDVAIGRLSASSPAEARSIAEKIVAFESRNRLLSPRSIVVADNVDRGGDFEANAREIIEGILSSREPVSLLLGELGRDATRARIRQELDAGAGTLSYIGHGGIHLWADETIFQTSDVSSLAPQPEQPIALTMNCLNGYFHFPYFDSLAEALVSAPQKGAIAAVSPSGLSLDGPAHRFHQALLAEILQGGHDRLGDAILAAQRAYVDSGAYPDLIRIFHLFGDPALRLR